MIVRVSWYTVSLEWVIQNIPAELRVINQLHKRQIFVVLLHHLSDFSSVFLWVHDTLGSLATFHEWLSVQLWIWLISRRSQPWPWLVWIVGWTKPNLTSCLSGLSPAMRNVNKVQCFLGDAVLVIFQLSLKSCLVGVWKLNLWLISQVFKEYGHHCCYYHLIGQNLPSLGVSVRSWSRNCPNCMTYDSNDNDNDNGSDNSDHVGVAAVRLVLVRVVLLTHGTRVGQPPIQPASARLLSSILNKKYRMY